MGKTTNSKIFLFWIFAISACITAFGQTKTIQVLDKETEEPIPYASIQLNEKDGFVTNEEGRFSINLDNFKPEDLLLITSISYHKKSILIKELKNKNNIYLEENIDTLAEVYVASVNYDAEQIIDSIHFYRKRNYKFKGNKYRIFQRNTSYADIKGGEIEIAKMTDFKRKDRKEINKFLEKTKNELIKNYSRNKNYMDALGDLYLSNKDSLDLKVDMIKVTDLYDKKLDMTLFQEDIIEKVFQIFDTSSVFRVKSGILTIKDSLKYSRLLEGKRDSLGPKLHNKYFKYAFASPIFYSFGNPKYEIEFLEKPRKYDYTIRTKFIHNDILHYEILFHPSGSSGKFKGKMTVNMEDFAIVNMEYELLPNKKNKKF